MLLPFREHLDFGPTPYDQLQAKEGIPVVRGNVVSDVLELELGRWERMGVAGCYLNLADQQQTDAYICEMPPQPRLVRSMVEYFVPTVPFASYLFARWGQITGTPENCRRLLAAEEAVLVFPEGTRGISKNFSRRYQLAEFGKGFLRLALEMRAPIVPIAVIGAEEQAPAINVKPLARLFGAPSFPVVPYPPFLPLVPLPVKYRLYFGEPIRMTGDPDDDDEVLDEKARIVTGRAALQRSLAAFMRYYNDDRPHQGYRLRGRSPSALVWGAVKA